MLVLKINLYSNVQSLTNQDLIHDIVINFVSACPVLVFLVCTDPKMLIEACRSLLLFLEAVTDLDRMVTFFILNFYPACGQLSDVNQLPIYYRSASLRCGFLLLQPSHLNWKKIYFWIMWNRPLLEIIN